MRASTRTLAAVLLTLHLAAGVAPADVQSTESRPPEAAASTAGHPGFLGPLANPIALADGLVLVANTPGTGIDTPPTLAGILKQAGWEGIVGTWVDKARWQRTAV